MQQAMENNQFGIFLGHFIANTNTLQTFSIAEKQKKNIFSSKEVKVIEKVSDRPQRSTRKFCVDHVELDTCVRFHFSWTFAARGP